MIEKIKKLKVADLETILKQTGVKDFQFKMSPFHSSLLNYLEETVASRTQRNHFLSGIS